MDFIRLLIFVCLLSLGTVSLPPFKNFIRRKTRFVFSKIKFSSRRIYRVLNANKSADFVWKDLINTIKALDEILDNLTMTNISSVLL